MLLYPSFNLSAVYNSKFSMVFGSFNLPVSKHVAAISPDHRRHFRRPHSKRSGRGLCKV